MSQQEEDLQEQSSGGTVDQQENTATESQTDGEENTAPEVEAASEQTQEQQKSDETVEDLPSEETNNQDQTKTSEEVSTTPENSSDNGESSPDENPVETPPQPGLDQVAACTSLSTVGSHDTEKLEEEISNWSEHSTPSQLMALPFDSVGHLSDQYEVALISLYKKKWSFRKIMFMHFFFYAPLLEIPVLHIPNFFNKKFFWLRAGEITLFNILLFVLLYFFLNLSGYMELFPMLSSILFASLITGHLLMAWDTFVPWKQAYSHVDHSFLDSYLPKKKKKRNKKTTKKIAA